MAWQYETASLRIDKLLASVPLVRSLNFQTEWYPTILEEARTGRRSSVDFATAFRSINRNSAIVVDGVHVYARLVNYDDYRLEDGQETERADKRSLNFLHLHYAACDRIIEEFGAVRVDYHGGRLHCVVVDPIDDEMARVAKAIELANRLIEFSVIANRDIGQNNYPAKLKIGIDSGRCVAINNGSGLEQEPLFLGSAANYAAKLAEGNGDGIFLSRRAREIVGLATLPSIVEERVVPIDIDSRFRISTAARARVVELGKFFDGTEKKNQDLIASWQAEIRLFADARGGQSAFRFREHIPPLKTIDFSDLSPANSIRMPLVSIFADVSGYTKFIDQAMATGNIGAAIRAIHVIRGELNNVLKGDFQSRKVRYIGDCIQGLIAFGQANAVDRAKTSIEAVKCAAAMRSSFNLIKDKLEGLDSLGLAIGVEFGTTPVSRIGRRGDRSVRVATSTATIVSEQEQSDVDGKTLALGPVAFGLLPLHIRNEFEDRKIEGLDADAYDITFAGAPAIVSAAGESPRAHGFETKQQQPSPARAHSQLG